MRRSFQFAAVALSVALLAVSAGALVACSADWIFGCQTGCAMPKPQDNKVEAACCCKPASEVTAAPTAQASAAQAPGAVASSSAPATFAPVLAAPRSQTVIAEVPLANGPPLAQICTFLI